MAFRWWSERPAKSLFPMVTASVGNVADAFYPLQRSPRRNRLQHHASMGQTALDRHVHGIDASSPFGNIEIP